MNSVIIAAILLGICQFVAVYCGCLLLRRMLNAKQAELEQKAERIFQEWAMPPKAGEPSKLMLILQAAGGVVGAAAAQSIMASMSASASQDARMANKISDGIELQRNPLFGLLAGGKRGKGAAMKRMLELAGSLFSGPHGPGNGAAPGSSGSQTSMSL